MGTQSHGSTAARHSHDRQATENELHYWMLKRKILMTSKSQITSTKYTFAVLMAFVMLAVNIMPALAKEPVPTLDVFIKSVNNGDAKMLRGVYVQDVLAYPIVQQPASSAGFVSTDSTVVTQFNMAAQMGNVGLLAHNYLAGKTFKSLAVGHVVVLVYGDGHTEKFAVTHIYQYQALDPYSQTSKFKDLSTNTTITADALFGLVYRGNRHVTFQTCIEQGGSLSWGRLFVIAEPVK